MIATSLDARARRGPWCSRTTASPCSRTTASPCTRTTGASPLLIALVVLAGWTSAALAASDDAVARAEAEGAATDEGDEWAVLETDDGRIVINLLDEVAPEHVANFEKLVRQGWFDGSPFHRVIEGFMAQGGGHWSEDGTVRDVGYTLPAEIDPRLRHVRGAVAAARRGDEVNPTRRSSGSQFYVCFANAQWLDRQYTIFGHVVLGMDVIDRVARGRPDGDGTVPREAATVIRRAWLQPASEIRATLPARPVAHDHDHDHGAP